MAGRPPRCGGTARSPRGRTGGSEASWKGKGTADHEKELTRELTLEEPFSGLAVKVASDPTLGPWLSSRVLGFDHRGPEGATQGLLVAECQ